MAKVQMIFMIAQKTFTIFAILL